LEFDIAAFEDLAWSRRISQEHRLVYQVRKDKIRIPACRYHY
jgi:toxin YoeB